MLHPLSNTRVSSWCTVSALFGRIRTQARAARTKHVLVASLLLPATDPPVSSLPGTHLEPSNRLRLFDRTRSRRLRSALRYEAKHVAAKTLVLCRFELLPRFFFPPGLGFSYGAGGTKGCFVPFEKGVWFGVEPRRDWESSLGRPGWSLREDTRVGWGRGGDPRRGRGSVVDTPGDASQ